MRKPRRRKLVRQDLEGLLAKYERRIQRCAEQAYRIRQLMEAMDKQDTTKKKITVDPSKEVVETALAVAGEQTTQRVIIEEPKGEENAL